MPTNEKNIARMFGVLPSQGADPIPVSIDAYGADPLAIPPAAFTPYLDTYDYTLDVTDLMNRTALGPQYFMAPVNFPDKVTVTALTLYGWRLAAPAVMILALFRVTRSNVMVQMSSVTADWGGAYGSLTDSTIANPIVDNVNYQYVLQLTLDPNTAVTDVQFTGATITFA